MCRNVPYRSFDPTPRRLPRPIDPVTLSPVVVYCFAHIGFVFLALCCLSFPRLTYSLAPVTCRPPPSVCPPSSVWLWPSADSLMVCSSRSTKTIGRGRRLGCRSRHQCILFLFLSSLDAPATHTHALSTTPTWHALRSPVTRHNTALPHFYRIALLCLIILLSTFICFYTSHSLYRAVSYSTSPAGDTRTVVNNSLPRSSNDSPSVDHSTLRMRIRVAS